jgi:hypothetical protein
MNITEAAKQFARWKDGSCQFCDEVKGQSDEKIQLHTFFDQINMNPVITQVAFEIGIISKKTNDKVRSFKDMWEDD